MYLRIKKELNERGCSGNTLGQSRYHLPGPASGRVSYSYLMGQSRFDLKIFVGNGAVPVLSWVGVGSQNLTHTGLINESK